MKKQKDRSLHLTFPLIYSCSKNSIDIYLIMMKKKVNIKRMFHHPSQEIIINNNNKNKNPSVIFVIRSCPMEYAHVLLNR